MEEIQESPPSVEVRSSSRIQSWINSEPLERALELVIGALVIGTVFWWLQRRTQAICCGDFDGYYHIKWARLIWENWRAKHFLPAFTWLPLTTLNAHDYVDHHLLFHVLLIPFTWFRDLQTGAKVAALDLAAPSLPESLILSDTFGFGLHGTWLRLSANGVSADASRIGAVFSVYL